MKRVLLALWLAVFLTACGGGQGGQTGAGATQETVPPGNEFAEQISVDARLEPVPGVGETAELSIEVSPVARDLAGEAQIEVELAANLELVGRPDSLRVVGTSVNPARGGPKLSASFALEQGVTERFRVRVRALSPGRGEIAVFVTTPVPHGTAGGADYVFLTVPD